MYLFYHLKKNNAIKLKGACQIYNKPGAYPYSLLILSNKNLLNQVKNNFNVSLFAFALKSLTIGKKLALFFLYMVGPALNASRNCRDSLEGKV